MRPSIWALTAAISISIPLVSSGCSSATEERWQSRSAGENETHATLVHVELSRDLEFLASMCVPPRVAAYPECFERDHRLRARVNEFYECSDSSPCVSSELSNFATRVFLSNCNESTCSYSTFESGILNDFPLFCSVMGIDLSTLSREDTGGQIAVTYRSLEAAEYVFRSPYDPQGRLSPQGYGPMFGRDAALLCAQLSPEQYFSESE
jgi:hypothetical protein